MPPRTLHSAPESAPGTDLDAVFAALADPTRRAIVAQLAKGERSVNELALPHRISGPAVTKHLKVLQGAGLIARSKRAQQRPCRLIPSPLKEATDWMEQYRLLWEARLDRLDDYLMELQGKTKRKKRGQEQCNSATVNNTAIEPKI
jgi:DNA-binding transcriptional ArsR family regulator